MTSAEIDDDTEIQQEADSIAANITRILVDAFKVKEGRDPTNDEIELLINELTEERIAELLGQTPASSSGNHQISGDEDDGSDEENENDEAIIQAEVATPAVTESVAVETETEEAPKAIESPSLKRKLDQAEIFDESMDRETCKTVN